MSTKFPEAGRFPRQSDVECSDLPAFKAKYNQDWGLQSGEKGDDDLPGNPLNNPVELHKGEFPVNGWQEIASDVVAEAGSGKTGGGNAGEKR